MNTHRYTYTENTNVVKGEICWGKDIWEFFVLFLQIFCKSNMSKEVKKHYMYHIFTVFINICIHLSKN